jgi:hypothetical protein
MVGLENGCKKVEVLLGGVGNAYLLNGFEDALAHYIKCVVLWSLVESKISFSLPAQSLKRVGARLICLCVVICTLCNTEKN